MRELATLRAQLAAERTKREEVERERDTARAALEYIKPALPVLANMMKTARLHMGEQKALDMAESVNAALAPAPEAAAEREADEAFPGQPETDRDF